jgi:hypothetical protein
LSLIGAFLANLLKKKKKKGKMKKMKKRNTHASKPAVELIKAWCCVVVHFGDCGLTFLAIQAPSDHITCV